MAKQFKKAESFIKAAGKKYRLSTKQGQHLRKKGKKQKRKPLKGSWFLLIITVLLLIVWQNFIKSNPKLPVGNNLAMHFIDVGQGDCTLICTNGRNMLVDCGENEYADDVVSYLNGLGVKKLDYIIATHPHSDHMGGMHRIIDTFDVGEVILPEIPDNKIPTSVFYERFLDSCAASSVKVTENSAGRKFSFGDAAIELVSPDGSLYSDLNNYSVSFILTHGRNRFLFTGDSEADAERKMLESGRLGKVTLYKAGHHGSASSSSEELLKTIRPETAVIFCGAGNSYGHPADSTVERLKKYTDSICRTDLCGTVIAESDGEQLTVTTERSAE